MISGALGSAPRGSQGDCLDSSFDDDAAGSIPSPGWRRPRDQRGRRHRHGRRWDAGASRSGTGSAGGGGRAVTTTTAPAVRPGRR